MEGNIFINVALTNAIKDYLNYKTTPDSKEYNSFLVNVIRMLVFIYGELDIINPYRTNNIAGLGGFDNNLQKFGLSDNELNEFKNQLMVYYQNESNLKLLSSSFVTIQKLLISMFLLKKSHILISDDEVNIFKSMLYFKEDTNVFKVELYNSLTPNSSEIMNYFNSLLHEQKHNYVFTKHKDIALSQEAYQIAGYNIVEVMNMNEKEIENVNNKVFHFFRIKDTDLNKRKRLESAIEYYKKYGNTITSGNGYVDTLLLAGFIATGLMIIILFAIRLMG